MNTMKNSATIEFSTTCKPFTAYGRGQWDVLVEGTDVLVYDPIAHHHTRLHSLSRSVQRRIRREAETLRGARNG